MKNKMLLILGVVIILFASLLIVINIKNKQSVEGDNPYDKDKLDQSTIDLLKDENYQNIIVPSDLEEKLENKEDTTVYYFSPTCTYCQQLTPILMPLADDLDIDIQQLNVLEYEEEKAKYKIEGTPTLIHFEDGEEVGRISGVPEEDVEGKYEEFLEEVVLN